MQANRIQNKLQRDKTAEAKELLFKEETINALNDDLNNKLRDEKAKFDKLLDERINLEEKIKRRKAKFEEDKLVITDQDSKIKEIQDLIKE